MYRGTTPTHKFCFGTTDPNDFKEILITYVQNDEIVMEKRKDDLVITSEEIPSDEEPIVHFHATVKLSQEEANLFSADPKSIVAIQLRAIDYLGNVLASNKMKFSVLDVLNDEVLE